MIFVIITFIFFIYNEPVYSFTTNDDSLLGDTLFLNINIVCFVLVVVLKDLSFCSIYNLQTDKPREIDDETRWLPVQIGDRVKDDEDNEAEIFFHRTDDEDTLSSLAFDFTFARFDISAGDSCDSKCVTKAFVEKMQQHSLYSPINYGGNGKVGLREISEAIEDNRLNSDSFASGIWAPVPCVPPYCTFECAQYEQNNMNFMSEFEKDMIALNQYGISYTSDIIPRKCNNGTIYPIGFAIPEESIVSCVPHKSRGFAVNKVSSGKYQFQATEEHEYRRQIRSSFFSHTVFFFPKLFIYFFIYYI